MNKPKTKAFLILVACFLLNKATISQTHDLTNGLVFYLPFNGNVADQSSSGIPVFQVMTPGLVADKDANPSSAIGLNGTSQSLRLESSDVSMLEFGGGDFSLGFWVKKNSATTNYFNAPGINKWHSGLQPSLNEWALNIGGADGGSSDKPSFRLQLGSNMYTASPATTTIDVGQWMHIMGVREGANIKLYVDGVLESTVNVGSAAIDHGTSNPSDILIGRYFVNSEHSDAVFDDVVIYDRALSSSEIGELITYGVTAGSGSPGGSIGDGSLGFDLTQELLFYLPMDNSTVDQSISAIPVVEVNSPSFVNDREDNAVSALDLDGINQSLRLEDEDAGALEFGTGDFSVGFWVKKNSPTVSNNNAPGINKWHSTLQPTLNEWSLSIGGGGGASSDKPSFKLQLGTQVYSATPVLTTVDAGVWTHLMGVREGADIKLYVDGILRSTVTTGTGSIDHSAPNPSDVLIGRSINSIFSEATFDDIVIYGKALSANEIAQLMIYGVTDGAGVIPVGQSLWSESGAGNIYYDKGKVSIGVNYNHAEFALAVRGQILTDGVLVKTYPNWPDYVFEPDFDLLPIDELERFISLNKHLPGVPSARQVLNNGVELAFMDAVLLQKIEELTLYTIDQEKRLKAQDELIKSLIKRIEVLEAK